MKGHCCDQISKRQNFSNFDIEYFEYNNKCKYTKLDVFKF